MKSYRSLPKLENFEVYRPPAQEATRRRPRRYDPAEMLTKRQRVASWVCRIVAASIMLETLFFKFTGAPESVYIFSRLDMEPWWRYGQGIWELIASILLLTSRFAWAGGILTLGAIGAAIVSHLTILGIEIQGDGGLLFGMAWTSFASAAIVTFIHRYEIPSYTEM